MENGYDWLICPLKRRVEKSRSNRSDSNEKFYEPGLAFLAYFFSFAVIKAEPLMTSGDVGLIHLSLLKKNFKGQNIRGLALYFAALDIFSAIKIIKVSVEKVVADVITQVFEITLNEVQLKHYRCKIEQLLNVE